MPLGREKLPLLRLELLVRQKPLVAEFAEAAQLIGQVELRFGRWGWVGNRPSCGA
jgi:hypothetical protein